MASMSSDTPQKTGPLYTLIPNKSGGLAYKVSLRRHLNVGVAQGKIRLGPIRICEYEYLAWWAAPVFWFLLVRTYGV